MPRTYIHEVRAAYAMMKKPFFAYELQEINPSFSIDMLKNSLRVMRNNGEVESELVPYRNRMEYRYTPGTPSAPLRQDTTHDIGNEQAALRLAHALGIQKQAAFGGP